MDQLTPRQYQVAKLIARGLSNGEVARKLGISYGTAKLHVHRIYKKLGVKNKSAAIAIMHRRSGSRQRPHLPAPRSGTAQAKATLVRKRERRGETRARGTLSC
jgi:DNA-binding CsgD family transcriptional regulator